jgi:hypothetical protein
MLGDRDGELIRTLERFWRWEFCGVDTPPQNLYDRLVAMSGDPELLECIEILTDIRMLTVAVRSKILNKKISRPAGRWGAHIVRNWSVPDFGLSVRFPWLTEFRALLENKQYTQGERKVCHVVWREMARIADGHYFDLPALIAYLIRWDLVNRWAVRDPDSGCNRFDTLVEEAIGDNAGQIQ